MKIRIIIYGIIINGFLYQTINGQGLRLQNLVLGNYGKNCVYLSNALQDTVINKDSITPKWVYGVEFAGAAATDIAWGAWMLSGDYTAPAVFQFTETILIGIPLTSLAVWATGNLLGREGSFLGSFWGTIAGCFCGTLMGIMSGDSNNTASKIELGIACCCPAIGAAIGYNYK